MRKRFAALPVVLVVVLSLLGLAPPAQAHQAQDHSARSDLFLVAKLSGANEVPTPGGPAVGDPEGRGTAVVRVRNNQVSFALSWRGIQAPSLGHIHEGAAGVNGPVRVPFFETPMPATATAAAGAVTVTDPAIATAIRRNPAGFYVNLHTAEFPGGAIRGQLKRVHKKLSLDLSVRGQLRAFLSGDQEVPVPGGPAVGDPDGRGLALVKLRRERVDFALAWIGVNPVLGHIHRGGFGVNGPVVVGFFDTPVPSTIFALAGTVRDVDQDLIREIRRNPRGFYVNLHTAEFPGGAIRGQLKRR